MRLKLKYSEIKDYSKEELLKMKKQAKIGLMNGEMFSTKREKGISPKETRKNIARINQRLKEL
ncbi:hypothetical protein CL617_04865 [archaeon]|nr:hypothetical protein [archaeon]|tara:strand:- start:5085 stop:5273 length:189 start_codon:yes stop_codon:yes gene_type:complete